MSRIAVKFLRFTSLTIGSLGLVVLSSPWALSHPTCLRFACSLLSAKTGKRIQCGGFHWQPFGKTEISSLSISHNELQCEVGHLTIDDPFIAIIDAIKQKPLLEILSSHVEIDSIYFKLDEKEFGSLKPRESGLDYVLSLYPKNWDFRFLQNNKQIAPLLPYLDSLIQKIPATLQACIEIPFSIELSPIENGIKTDFLLTSPEVHGKVSFTSGDLISFMGQFDSSWLPSYQLEWSGSCTKNFGLIGFNSAISTPLINGNSFQLSWNEREAKGRVHLTQLHHFLTEIEVDLPLTLNQIDLDALISFEGENTFTLDIASDPVQAHLLGHHERDAWTIEKGTVNLQFPKAESPPSWSESIAPQSLLLNLSNVAVSKITSEIESAEVDCTFVTDFPKLGLESVSTQIIAQCNGNTWNGRISSPFSEEPIELDLHINPSDILVSLGESVQISPLILAKISQLGVLVDTAVLKDLSFKLPLGKGQFPFSDLKMKLETSPISIQRDHGAMQLGALSLHLYSLNKPQEWRMAIESGEDHFTLQYRTVGNDLSSILNEGTLEIRKLPLGKWATSSLVSSTFELNGEIAHTSMENFSFDLNGASNEASSKLKDQFRCIGTLDPSQLTIQHAFYESSLKHPIPQYRKLKVSNFSYYPDRKEIFIEEALFEDVMEKKSTILASASSTDDGVKLDLKITDSLGASKLHFEALTPSLLTSQSIAGQRMELQADHFPLSILFERKIPYAEELQQILGDEFTCSLCIAGGELKSKLRSSKWMVSFSGHIADDLLIADKPFFAQITLDEAALNQLAKWTSSADLAHCKFAHPLNLRIDQDSFQIPLDMDLTKLSAHGSLELGQFISPTPAFGRSLFKLLKQKESKTLLNFWATPVNFQIDHGNFKLERVDLLVDQKLHLALWGKGDLPANQMNCHLGIAQDTLSDLFNLHGLPHDFLLSLPLKYKNQKIDLDVKESLQSIEQILLLQGAISGALPAWLDQFLQLGKNALLPYPPLEANLPWIIASNEELPKKAKNKLKPKEKEEETTKPQEKASTVEKAKEWVELFKIFKVLN